MIVEPIANDKVEENFNPIGGVFYRPRPWCARRLRDLRKSAAGWAPRPANAAAPGRDRGGFQTYSPGDRDAVQHDLRSAFLTVRIRPHAAGGAALSAGLPGALWRLLADIRAGSSNVRFGILADVDAICLSPNVRGCCSLADARNTLLGGSDETARFHHSTWYCGYVAARGPSAATGEDEADRLR